MIDKLAINNELILMKTEILPAKLTVTRKLVKRLKECKSNLEKCDEKLSKKKGNLKLKIEKIISLIEYLKHTSPRELAGLLITTKKEPKKVLTNANASVSEVAIAHLGGFKTIIDKLADIKTRHGLDDNDEEWRKRILEHGKNKKIKLQKEAHKKMNKERKQQEKERKNRERKRKDWLKENGQLTENGDEPSADSNEEASQINGDGSDDECNNEDDGLENGTVDGGDSDEESNQSSEEDGHTSEVSDDDEKLVANESENDEIVEVKSVIKPKFTKTPIKPTNQSVKLAKTIKSSTKTKTIEKAVKMTKEKLEKAADPFFVVNSGDNYMSSVVIDRKQAENPAESGYGSKQNRGQKRASGTSDWWNNNRTNSSQTTKAKMVPNKQTRLERPIQQKNTAKETFAKKNIIPKKEGIVNKEAPVEKELHPSWVAKQKLKPTITEFKGSKIVFSDD